ncbi:MAG: hypothetical protein LQ342_004009 [Letrouitia transgressa]|nr:MAG: hypothetical protein LQ342_004009 [Letrouitia transgressa]
MTEPLWQRNYIRLVESQKDNHGRKEGSEPEFRLPPAITGGLLVPVGLFWFAWTTYPSDHYMIPIIGSTVFGCGSVTLS